MNELLKSRILSKIKISENGCWIWGGAVFKKTSGSYGQIRINDSLKRVHRITYEIYKGEIKNGLEIDHLCKHTLCVNPAHLEAVTHQENVRRGATFNKTNFCMRGHEYTNWNTQWKDGKYRTCRRCSIDKSRIWYKNNRDRALKNFKKRYRLSVIARKRFKVT